MSVFQSYYLQLLRPSGYLHVMVVSVLYKWSSESFFTFELCCDYLTDQSIIDSPIKVKLLVIFTYQKSLGLG